MMEGLVRKVPGYADELRRHGIRAPKVKTKEELDEMDAFNVINGEDNAELFEKYRREADELVESSNSITITMPPLKEGVFKVMFNNAAEYIHWNVVDTAEQYYRVEINCYTIRKESANYQASFVLSSDEVDSFLNHPEITSFADVVREVPKRKFFNTNDKKIVDYFSSLLESMQPLMEMASVWALKHWLIAMHLFSDLLEEDRKEQFPSGERVSVKYGFRKDNGYKRRVIYLGNVQVECARENSGIAIRRGQIVRRTDCWGVRGHYRHYQNGRVIYIAPYEKGQNRNSGRTQGKEYKVR